MTPALTSRILDRILGDEGGVANHPDDRGGLTNYGLTRPFLKWVTGRDWTDAEIIQIDARRARGVYGLWLAMTRLEQLPDHELLAWVVTDFAVHSGHRPAIRAVQRAMGIPADGIAGPETQGTWHLLSETACRQTAAAVIAERLTYLGGIVAADPSQASFIKGWLVRVGQQVRACAA